VGRITHLPQRLARSAVDPQFAQTRAVRCYEAACPALPERSQLTSVCRANESNPAFVHSKREDITMLKWALICAVIAIIAGALGFTGVAGAAAGIAKFLFFAFLVIFLIMLIAGIAAGKKVSSAVRRNDQP
jgi:uncharacterized membrane protein YtjA (UPF0391 family)